MRDTLSSMEPFEGECGDHRITIEIDSHMVQMLNRLCKHYNYTRDQMIALAIEKDYLGMHNWGDPKRDAWEIGVLKQAAEVVALWKAGRLRTFTYFIADVIHGPRKRPLHAHPGFHHEVKWLEDPTKS